MFKFLTPLFLVALLVPTAPTQAQTTAPELDLGQTVEPQLGQRYAKEQYGDWTLACIRIEAETDPCSLLQVVLDDQGAPVAEVSLFKLEDGGQAVAGATIIVPLETFLPAQLTISIDGAPGKRYNYVYCNQVGCIAQIGLTAQDIQAYSQGKAATIQLVPAPAPDQLITMPMSLDGFSAGFDAVEVVVR